jgi:hypothetical protein
VAVAFTHPTDAVAELCADPSAEPAGIERDQGMILLGQNGRYKTSENIPDVPVAVYGGVPGVLTSFCDLQPQNLVATGAVRFNETGSDWSGEAPGGDVLHVTLEGIVTLVAGGQARLHATLQVVIHGDNTLHVDREIVTLTPI